MGIDPLGGKLFKLIEQKCEPLLHQFSSQNLSNFLIAAVLLEKPLSERFLDNLAKQAVLQMPRATPQGVANLLWSIAKLTNASPLEGDLFRSGISTALEVGPYMFWGNQFPHGWSGFWSGVSATDKTEDIGSQLGQVLGSGGAGIGKRKARFSIALEQYLSWC